MRARAAAAVLALASLLALPGCVVSLFSEFTVSQDALTRTERLEQRMDRIDEVMRTTPRD